MYILRVNDGQRIVIDTAVHAVTQLNWRIYTKDDYKTAEAANDCVIAGVRTTQMLSRFIMERVLGRELDADEIVARKKQKYIGMWDFRASNLELRKIR